MKSKVESRDITCLGIDPGLGRLGFGVIRKTGQSYMVLEFGCIETPPHTDVSLRIQTLYEDIRTRIEKWKPDFICIEKLFFGRNTTTAGNVWQARGTMLLLAAQFNLEYIEPKPNQIKLAICGSGTADKSQIQRMLKKLLGLNDIPRPDDAADAIAIAITGIALYSFNKKIR